MYGSRDEADGPETATDGSGETARCACTAPASSRRSVRQAGDQEPEEASEQAGSQEPEEASEQAGSQEPEEASEQAGSQEPEEASEQAGGR
ncbi:unnamed protein product [Boreogadus saida]